jgi:hypothetical protein
MKIQEKEPWFWILNFLFFNLTFIIYDSFSYDNTYVDFALITIVSLVLLVIIFIRFDVSEIIFISKFLAIFYILPGIVTLGILVLISYSLIPQGVTKFDRFEEYLAAVIIYSIPFAISLCNVQFLASKSKSKFLVMSFSYYVVWFVITMPLLDLISFDGMCGN